jgi:hypothetical protein
VKGYIRGIEPGPTDVLWQWSQVAKVSVVAWLDGRAAAPEIQVARQLEGPQPWQSKQL